MIRVSDAELAMGARVAEKEPEIVQEGIEYRKILGTC